MFFPELEINYWPFHAHSLPFSCCVVSLEGWRISSCTNLALPWSLPSIWTQPLKVLTGGKRAGKRHPRYGDIPGMDPLASSLPGQGLAVAVFLYLNPELLFGTHKIIGTTFFLFPFRASGDGRSPSLSYILSPFTTGFFNYPTWVLHLCLAGTLINTFSFYVSMG